MNMIKIIIFFYLNALNLSIFVNIYKIRVILLFKHFNLINNNLKIAF